MNKLTQKGKLLGESRETYGPTPIRGRSVVRPDGTHALSGEGERAGYFALTSRRNKACSVAGLGRYLNFGKLSGVGFELNLLLQTE